MTFPSEQTHRNLTPAVSILFKSFSDLPLVSQFSTVATQVHSLMTSKLFFHLFINQHHWAPPAGIPPTRPLPCGACGLPPGWELRTWYPGPEGIPGHIFLVRGPSVCAPTWGTFSPMDRPTAQLFIS